MENRSHDQGCRKQLQTSRSGLSALVMQENKSQEWLHLVLEGQVFLIQGRENGKRDYWRLPLSLCLYICFNDKCGERAIFL